MKMNRPLIASIVSILLATACCWLPALILGLGFGGVAVSLSEELGLVSNILLIAGAGFLTWGLFRVFKGATPNIIDTSEITCPSCGSIRVETMPTDACMFFYECKACREILRPMAGDCCVFCSYGSIKCPPVQEGNICC